jgi:hypothetical protein
MNRFSRFAALEKALERLLPSEGLLRNRPE